MRGGRHHQTPGRGKGLHTGAPCFVSPARLFPLSSLCFRLQQTPSEGHLRHLSLQRWGFSDPKIRCAPRDSIPCSPHALNRPYLASCFQPVKYNGAIQTSAFRNRPLMGIVTSAAHACSLVTVRCALSLGDVVKEKK